MSKTPSRPANEQTAAGDPAPHDPVAHDPVAHDPGTPVYDHGAGGWGSLKGIAHIVGEAGSSATALRILAGQNKPRGIMCTSCAWAKPAKPHTFEFCENGAKATLWELASARADRDFFAGHTLAGLRGWHDHDLEKAGRLTEPMRYDAASDRYLPVGWDEAFAEIGGELRGTRSRSKRCSTRRAMPGWRRPISMRSSPGPSATRTCRSPPTCATRPRR